MDRKQEMLQELVSFSEKHFAHRDHFVCVYGSYASGHHTEKSDMDMFIAIEAHDEEDFKRVRDFLIDLHIRYGLSLDDEVPYENKILVSYEDVQHAIALDSFIKNGERYQVPLVKKDQGFLASLEIRWRLILNALTSPHEYLYGNKESYTTFKTSAEKSIVRLARGLIRNGESTPKGLLTVLMVGASGEDGEMYLGYKKERGAVIEYLENIIKRHYSV